MATHRRLLLVLASAIVLGCGGAPASSGPPASDPGPIPSGSAAPVPSPADPEPSRAPLPAPTLRDGAAIRESLRDPTRAADGVVSLLAVAGWQQPLGLTDDEVGGLIVMAEHDAATISAGGSPATLGDLHRTVAPLLPELTLEDVLHAYATAYLAAPDALLPALMSGTAFDDGGATVTRIELWALLVDGFVMPALVASGPQVASLSMIVPQVPFGTPGLLLPPIPSPDPRLDMTEFALLVAHLTPLAYAIPFDLAPSVATAHEGHGRRGRVSEFVARHRSWYQPPPSPLRGIPLLLPASGVLDGLPITWSSPTEPLLAKHGSLTGTLGAAVATDATGSVRIGFEPRVEPGDQSGALVTDDAALVATVSLRDLMLAHYAVPAGALQFLIGERVSFASIRLEWHETPAIELEISSTIQATKLNALPASGMLVATGTIRLERDPTSGTWSGTGTLSATSTGTAACNTVSVNGGGTYDWVVREAVVGPDVGAATVVHMDSGPINETPDQSTLTNCPGPTITGDTNAWENLFFISHLQDFQAKGFRVDGWTIVATDATWTSGGVIGTREWTEACAGGTVSPPALPSGVELPPDAFEVVACTGTTTFTLRFVPGGP